MSIDVKNRQTKYCISDPVMHTKKQSLSHESKADSLFENQLMLPITMKV